MPDEPLAEIRVLLVDDEEVFRDTLSKILRKRGFRVNAVAGGEEALAVLEGETFDVVVLDLKMPGIDGLETLKRMEERAGAPPVVVLTGHGTVQAGLEALQVLAFDFLLKPVPTETLALVIRAAAETGRTGRG